MVKYCTVGVDKTSFLGSGRGATTIRAPGLVDIPRFLLLSLDRSDRARSSLIATARRIKNIHVASHKPCSPRSETIDVIFGIHSLSTKRDSAIAVSRWLMAMMKLMSWQINVHTGPIFPRIDRVDRYASSNYPMLFVEPVGFT